MANHIGQVLWTDLTVPNADEVRDFYQAVIGWSASGVDMGGYEDYSMLAPGDPMAKTTEEAKMVAGVCHTRGDNADMPAQWLIYVGVDDLDRARTATEEKGGKIVTKIKSFGKDRFCVVSDPAGAVIGLYEKN
jgi:hypothetical protein